MHCKGGHKMTANRFGMVCPVNPEHNQDWVWSFMVDKAWLDEQMAALP